MTLRIGTIVRTMAVLGLLGAAVWVFMLRQGSTEAHVARLALPVVVTWAEAVDLRKELHLSSAIDANHTVMVVPKVSGTLIDLGAEVGHVVREGQVLGQVDPEAYSLALDQARIARDSTAAELSRAERLAETGSVTQQVLDQARAQAEASEAQFRLAQLNLKNTTITAPVAGTVVQRSVAKGAMVSPGIALVGIDATAELLVSAQVPEQYVRPFLEGTIQSVAVAVPSAGIVSLPATIRHLSPLVRQDTKTFEVTCAVGGDHRALIPGLSVEITFVLEEHPGVPALPLEALVGGDTLWYLDKDTGVARRVSLVEPYRDNRYFELPATLDPTLPYIVEGQHFLREGTEVRVINQSDLAEGNPHEAE